MNLPQAVHVSGIRGRCQRLHGHRLPVPGPRTKNSACAKAASRGRPRSAPTRDRTSAPAPPARTPAADGAWRRGGGRAAWHHPRQRRLQAWPPARREPKERGMGHGERYATRCRPDATAARLKRVRGGIEHRGGHTTARHFPCFPGFHRAPPSCHSCLVFSAMLVRALAPAPAPRRRPCPALPWGSCARGVRPPGDRGPGQDDRSPSAGLQRPAARGRPPRHTGRALAWSRLAAGMVVPSVPAPCDAAAHSGSRAAGTSPGATMCRDADRHTARRESRRAACRSRR